MPSLAYSDTSLCEGLLNLRLARTEIIKTETITTGSIADANDQTYEVPTFCRVHGLVRLEPGSNINFEVWMPAQQWNGRYHQHGQGGIGGKINYAALARILNQGGVAVATDDGHTRDKDGGATWARDERKVIDVFTLSLKTTYDRAQDIVRHYYRQAPQYRYFSGCSGGGRQALIAAQRYPEDWDGIIAGAPGPDITGYSRAAAYGQLWRNNPEGRIGPQKFPAIQKAALDSCSTDAQVVEGVASDPRFCKPNPDTVACTEEETDDCLTEPQRLMLKTLYNGIADTVTGEIIYPGFIPTMENAGGWPIWVTGTSPDNNQAPLSVFLGNRFFRNFVYNDPGWDVAQFNLTRDQSFAENKTLSGETFSSIMNTNQVDLSPLKKSGTKLITYDGWGDLGIVPNSLLNYHNKVVVKMGGDKQIRDFYRLFMVPGMLHCGSGPGANVFGQLYDIKNDADHNIVRALEAWVEKGVAPDRIIATKYVDDKPEKGVAFTRPLCPFPQVSKYKGTGSTDLAVNFKCIEGATP